MELYCFIWLLSIFLLPGVTLTMTNADRNLEPRVEALEVDMQELKRSISDLKSTVSTLADIVSVHEQLHEETRQRFEQSQQRFEQSQQRFEQFVTQAEADRALMLQLIQAIAQGRNGGT